MITNLSWIVSSILFILSGIHIYWLLGGKAGIQMVIPSTGSDKLFMPTKLATAAVAVLLMMAGFLVLMVSNIVNLSFMPKWLVTVGAWVLAIVFLGRTIGDFRWLGVFKKNKQTLFAKWDTLLFSPLCFIISVGVVVLLVV